jgi:hypothetical protein
LEFDKHGNVQSGQHGRLRPHRHYERAVSEWERWRRGWVGGWGCEAACTWFTTCNNNKDLLRLEWCKLNSFSLSAVACCFRALWSWSLSAANMFNLF